MSLNSQLQRLLQQGMQAHDQGRLAEAESAYRTVLEQAPEQADALYFLGLLNHQAGRHEAACELFQRSLKQNRRNLHAQFHLAEALFALGRANEAIAAFRRALEIKPDFPEALGLMGCALRDAGKPEEALAAFRKVLRFAPEAVAAYVNIGSIFQDRGDRDAAVGQYRQALAFDASTPEANFNLGVLLLESGEYEAAKAHLVRAVERMPDRAEGWFHLGNAMRAIDSMESAVLAYEEAIRIQPDYAGAWLNKGISLQRLGRLTDARVAMERALSLEPESCLAYLNLGAVNLDMGYIDEAVACWRRVAGKTDLPGEADSNALLAMNYGMRSEDDIYSAHVGFGERCERVFPARTSWANAPLPERRLRIAYLSPDFRSHSCAYFIEPALANHDSADFEVYCYADVEHPDEVTARLQGLSVIWRNIHLVSDEEVCRRIGEDQIDVLVDLAGHTGRNRLPVFARKPAPVQVTYLGYPNTTGLRSIDYRLTDEWADPVGVADQYHTERLVRLPGGFLCYRPDPAAPEVNAPPAGAAGQVTFGCFNNLSKFSEDVISIWARLLDAVPDGRLILKSRALRDPVVCQHMHERFSRFGIAPDRVRLAGFIDSAQGHLGTYHEVDIGLDSFPYHGTTTTFEALWMGVPVVTLAGKTHVSRVGVSILSRMGLEELIAENAERYVEIAVALAQDQKRLAELRASLRDRVAAKGLTDGTAFTRQLESAYREMWRRYCSA